MTFLLFALISLTASLCVGFFGVAAEAGARKLNKMPVVRKAIDGILLFSLIDKVTDEGIARFYESIRRLFPFFKAVGFWMLLFLGIYWIFSLVILSAFLKLVFRVIMFVAVIGVGIWLLNGNNDRRR
ncbi:MAG: hypothetical protein ABJF10_08125 [Chthoniobacter sp.]|uniref:hypothetical protein n=1 Tax=Chthoniobacter sp. TaxID=2510640 RepID=UPI0032AA7960